MQGDFTARCTWSEKKENLKENGEGWGGCYPENIIWKSGGKTKGW